MLNPPLAAAVARRLGSCRVVREGEPLSGYHAAGPDGKLRLHVVSWGEMYCADCPFCGDSRGRFAVSHRYGQFDEVVGYKLRWLWKCYNTECQNEAAHRTRLRDLLEADLYLPAVRVPALVRVAAAELPPVEFPGVLVPLDVLPADHTAVRYVRDRAPPYDPAELAAVWGVSYAEHVPPRVRGAASAGRLILPVTLRQRLVGWQARYLGELDWKMTGVHKYLTFFPKSQTLYGLDAAGVGDYVALVEGGPSVWRHGPGAVAMLGKDFSAAQARLLAGALNGRPLVLVPDADDPDSARCFLEAAGKTVDAGHEGSIALAAIPPGIDPGDLPRASLHAVIREALKHAVIPVPKGDIFGHTPRHFAESTEGAPCSGAPVSA